MCLIASLQTICVSKVTNIVTVPCTSLIFLQFLPANNPLQTMPSGGLARFSWQSGFAPGGPVLSGCLKGWLKLTQVRTVDGLLLGLVLQLFLTFLPHKSQVPKEDGRP
jgi:hypothetical protein